MCTVEIIKIKHEARCLFYAGYEYTVTVAEEGPRTERFYVIVKNVNNRTFKFGCSNVVMRLYSTVVIKSFMNCCVEQKLLVPFNSGW